MTAPSASMYLADCPSVFPTGSVLATLLHFISDFHAEPAFLVPIRGGQPEILLKCGID
ncbi:hypothetical protein BDV97DRAFT_345466 [Delphinella strobiligena]|nr:hypothetical protein BDV97DRAFT_345466 [Delphinella strobiligena]